MKCQRELVLALWLVMILLSVILNCWLGSRPLKNHVNTVCKATSHLCDSRLHYMHETAINRVHNSATPRWHWYGVINTLPVWQLENESESKAYLWSTECWPTPSSVFHFVEPVGKFQHTVTVVSCAKMAEPIKMPFGLWTWAGQRKHVLDGFQTPVPRGNFEGRKGAHCKV